MARRPQGERVGHGSIVAGLNCGGSMNALDFSPDKSCVVVGGRDVLKIVQVLDEGLKERRNLRIGKKNLSFSSNDVKWHPQRASCFASGSTNGAVVVWNLERPGQRALQDMVFKEHRRSVNRICWHPEASSSLLSASQDATVKLWDLDTGMCQLTFKTKSEARDVMFNEYQRNTFAVACDNGHVQVWDIRKASGSVYKFLAHSGPVLAAQWHPLNRTVLATGGRDASIKVWDVEGQEAPLHTVQTIDVVGRVAWRPGHSFQLASCANLLDSRIHVWDVRRPFLPIATCRGHENPVTGLGWIESHLADPASNLLACSKDHWLGWHKLDKAYKPVEHIRTSSLAVGAFAIATIHDDVDRTASWDLDRGKDADIPSPDCRVTVREPVLDDGGQQWLGFDHEAFEFYASNYVVNGAPIQDLCAHNAAMAAEMGNHELEHTWTIVGMLYGNTAGATLAPAEGTAETNPASATAPSTATVAGDASTLSPTRPAATTTCVEETKGSDDPQEPATLVHRLNKANPEAAGKFDLSGSETDTGDESDYSYTSDSDFSSDSSYASSRTSGDDDAAVAEQEVMRQFMSAKDDVRVMTPRGAARDFGFATATTAANTAADASGAEPAATHDTPGTSGSSPATKASVLAPGVVPVGSEDVVADAEPAPEESLTLTIERVDDDEDVCKHVRAEAVRDVLEYYADNGDVQTCVSIASVLQAYSSEIASETQLQRWTWCYIDMLHRLQQWAPAAEIISRSDDEDVRRLNQANTLQDIGCKKCGDVIGADESLRCTGCKDSVSCCSLCEQPVRGLFVWCQGCGHGGHLGHMKTWFAENVLCPAGCGHACDFVARRTTGGASAVNDAAR